MRFGLWSESGPLPVREVAVRGRIINFCAEITIVQKYIPGDRSEATYKFPLDLFGALCGFEITLNGKKIAAEVKRREEANRMGDELLADMDSSEESLDDQPDIFVGNIGSLIPGQEIEVKVTIVVELPVHGQSIKLLLPAATISPNYDLDDRSADKDGSDKLSADDNKKTKLAHPFSLDLQVETPTNIVEIESPSHPMTVDVQRDGNKATVKLHKDDSRFEGNFVLHVEFEDPHAPASFIEQDSRSDSKAVVLSLWPQFAAKQAIPPSEIIFLVDCSSSMGGSCIEQVRSALQLILKKLPKGSYFNIYEFGSTFEKLFDQSVLLTDETLAQATERLKILDAELHGTELLAPLRDIFDAPPLNVPGLPRQLFVITDGQVPNTNAVLALVGKHAHNTRVFAFGIGERVSQYLVNGLARAGCGESEFVNANEPFEKKVHELHRKVLQPFLTDISVNWGTLSVVQAPKRLRTIFNGDRLLVYGLLSGAATEPSDVVVKGTSSEGPVTFTVNVDPSKARRPLTGRLVHTLAARSRIRDLELDELDGPRSRTSHEEIVKFSTQYKLASAYTSFVAVEQQKSDDDDDVKPEAPARLQLRSTLEISKELDIKSPRVADGKVADPLAPATNGLSPTSSENRASLDQSVGSEGSLDERHTLDDRSGLTQSMGVALSPTKKDRPNLRVETKKTTLSENAPPFVPGASLQSHPLLAAATDSGTFKLTPAIIMLFKDLPSSKQMPDQFIQPPPELAPALSEIINIGTTSGPRGIRMDPLPSPKSPSGLKGGFKKGHSRKDSYDNGPRTPSRASSFGPGSQRGMLRGSMDKLPMRPELLDNGQPVVPIAPPSENSWSTVSQAMKEAMDPQSLQAILRTTKGILNKLTIEKFDSLFDKLLNVGIRDIDILKGVIGQVFDKATTEPHFSTMYAVLCERLSLQCPEFPDEKGEKQSFRRILLNRCQEEFEGRSSIQIPEDIDPSEREDLEIKNKRRHLGNIRFIGELYKRNQLPEKVMHHCILSLLKLENPDEESMEALCKLVTTIGQKLETTTKLKETVNKYFQDLLALSENQELTSRIRFMIKDLIDLRANNWVPRIKQNEAKSLAAARAEIEMPEQMAPSTPTRGVPASPRASDSADRRAMPPPASRGGFSRGGGATPIGRSGLTSSDSRLATPEKAASTDEWETVGSSGRSGRRKLAVSTGQDVRGAWGSRGGALTSPRGKSTPYPAKGREDPRRPADKKDDGRSPLRVNLFSSLEEDSGASGPPPASAAPGRSALRSSSSGIRKGVSIQEPTKDEAAVLESKSDTLLAEFLSSREVEDATESIRELNAPHYHAQLVQKAVLLSLEKKDRDRDEMIKLMTRIQSTGLVPTADMAKGLGLLLADLESIGVDIPLAPKFVGKYIAALAVTDDNPLSLEFLAAGLPPLADGGYAANLISQLLNDLLSRFDDDTSKVNAIWRTAQLDVRSLLPASKRPINEFQRWLEDKELDILFDADEIARADAAVSPSKSNEDDDVDDDDEDDFGAVGDDDVDMDDILSSDIVASIEKNSKPAQAASVLSAPAAKAPAASQAPAAPVAAPAAAPAAAPPPSPQKPTGKYIPPAQRAAMAKEAEQAKDAPAAAAAAAAPPKSAWGTPAKPAPPASAPATPAAAPATPTAAPATPAATAATPAKPASATAAATPSPAKTAWSIPAAEFKPWAVGAADFKPSGVKLDSAAAPVEPTPSAPQPPSTSESAPGKSAPASVSVENVLKLQLKDGNFRGSADLYKLISPDFSFEKMGECMPAAIKPAAYIWPTALALAILQHSFSADADKWKPTAEKARKYLQDKITDQKLPVTVDELQADALKLLSSISS
eukprot:TRINITY_DN4612_c0_g1_i2.p1 TRINITY_DN4612_c0_g1~~TRINITY_DN4612_c0_g1_i2.p1  ORF type:complete len:1839 (+),score=606.15 TRINITY_DN4612_c0_g1_i2:180-5696(+)